MAVVKGTVSTGLVYPPSCGNVAVVKGTVSTGLVYPPSCGNVVVVKGTVWSVVGLWKCAGQRWPSLPISQWQCLTSVKIAAHRPMSKTVAVTHV